MVTPLDFTLNSKLTTDSKLSLGLSAFTKGILC